MCEPGVERNAKQCPMPVRLWQDRPQSNDAWEEIKIRILNELILGALCESLNQTLELILAKIDLTKCDHAICVEIGRVELVAREPGECCLVASFLGDDGQQRRARIW